MQISVETPHAHRHDGRSYCPLVVTLPSRKEALIRLYCLSLDEPVSMRESYCDVPAMSHVAGGSYDGS
jgi:hypothetical protein